MNKPMQVSDFSYALPEQLIAHYPLAERSQSRLLHVDSQQGRQAHLQFTDLPALLNSNDLLVFNNTRVIPARLFGHKSTGGKVEILVERIVDEQQALAHIRASKAPRQGARIILEQDIEAEVIAKQGDLYQLYVHAKEPLLAVLERIGHIPLPPYIKRPDEAADSERYQTVYAQHKGSVAAPTAGLHFDQALLQQLATKGIESAYVTLHVGAGTFQPVRVQNIAEHKMHQETVEVNAQVCQQIQAAKARGGRVIAVGTTTVRSLESVVVNGEVQPFSGETDIFIYPGYQFQVIDALLTNFHLPHSTLLMLVCAFGGYESVLAAYREAVQQCYRFFSYGDAMFISR